MNVHEIRPGDVLRFNAISGDAVELVIAVEPPRYLGSMMYQRIFTLSTRTIGRHTDVFGNDGWENVWVEGVDVVTQCTSTEPVV